MRDPTEGNTMSALGNLVRNPINTKLDQTLKAAPATLDKTLATAGATITGSIPKASELFARIYTDLAARVTGWLPSTKPWILTQLSKAVTKIKTNLQTL